MGNYDRPHMSIRTELRQVLAPPVAESIENVVENAHTMKKGSVDTASLNIIKTYVAGEPLSQPYTDKQILSHILKNDIYSYDLQRIAKARVHLGIKSSQERKK